MLNPTQVATIEQRLSQTEQRVIVTEIDGIKMVIKRQEKARPQSRYALLKFASKIFGQPVLAPAYAPGGAEAQKIEAARLTRLAAAGVPVPELLHVAPDWIAISYAGQYSIGRMIQKGELAPSVYWQQGLAAISEVHQKGQNLSQVFVRNAVWNDDKITFIDFEDDPEASLGLANAQARDWLFYLFSSVWMLEISPTQAAKIMFEYLQKDPIEVQNVILNSMKGIAWLRHLPSKRKPWGRDVVALNGIGTILYEMQQLNLNTPHKV